MLPLPGGAAGAREPTWQKCALSAAPHTKSCTPDAARVCCIQCSWPEKYAAAPPSASAAASA